MVFSSMLFLWTFLPIVFLGYRLLDHKYKNMFLLLASLYFYSWGEPKYITIMLISIVVNYILGLLVNKEDNILHRKIFLVLCILINLVLLGYFKYYNFFARNVNVIFNTELFEIKNIILPIGISFYTFQALSYVIDVYRKDIPVQKNLFNMALYICFFPQLIAGPIVKYHDIEKQIEGRSLTHVKTAYGIKRFIYGLSKKVILADSFAKTVDEIFVLDVASLSTFVIWLGVVLYSLQIYFDFSGYSDMAIGLGKLFGFDFLENFNYPYISTSIQDFWRRWHISLSTWFKEYLYIPLGGNRKGAGRTYLNLLIVFFATGFWHGASFNFIAWGFYYGLFLVVERLFLGKRLEKLRWKVINHIYTVIVIMVGWVFFRADGLKHALKLLKVMFIQQIGTVRADDFINTKLIILLVAGILLCGILQSLFKKWRISLYDESRSFWIENIAMFLLLFVSITLLINDTYNSFIYFRF